MATALNPTPGAPDANSFLTVEEADAYFEKRLHAEAWAASTEKEKALMHATSVLDRMARPFKEYVYGQPSYYHTHPSWTGTPATTTQKLSWPRNGMRDANGNPIAPTEIPVDLKDATAEMAFQLLGSDRTLDNQVLAQGLTSLKAGPVSMSFKNDFEVKVIPDAVMSMLPPSWLTSSVIESVPTTTATFEVVT